VENKKLLRQLLKSNKVIVKNFLSLSLLNVVNFLTPIITLPYLIEVLGVDGYGKYAFVYTILMYILMVVNFGFNFSATQDVAIHKDNPAILSKIFTEVFVIRIFLACFTLVVTALVFSQIPKFYETATLLVLGSGVVFGTTLLPNFLYQGLEKMKYITLGAALPKLIMISAIFFVVTKKEDLNLLMVVQSIGFMVSGVISTTIAFKYLKVKIVNFSIKDLVFRMKNSLNLFISTIGMSLYRESGTLILGVFTSFEIVGFYSAAEKIIRAVQAILNPIAQSIFPHFSNKFSKESSEKGTAIKSFSTFIRYYTFLLLAIVAGVVFVLPWIVTFFTDDKYNDSILNIRLLSPLVFFGSLNFVIGVVGLVNLGYDKYFTKGVLISGLIAISLSLLLVKPYQDMGVSISVSLTEIFLFFFLVKKFRSIQ
jgi:PST family polysaccharide transporter